MGFPGSVLLSQGDIHKETSDKIHPLGTRGYTRDGRVFRYAKSSVAISCGRIVQAAPVSNLDDALALAASADCDTTYTTDSRTFYVSSASFIHSTSKNYFRDGYIFVSSGSSHIGQYAQIKSHTAETTVATAGYRPAITIFPEDTFTKKLTTLCKVGLIKNPYDDVKMQAGVAANALSAMTVGITVMAISAADKYFWLQTWGPCAVITGGAALVLGQAFIVDTATGSSGAAEMQVITTAVMTTASCMNAVRLGQVLQIGNSSTNTSALVYLMLAP